MKRKINVLIAEDDFASVKYYLVILEKIANRLDVVSDGLAAVDFVRQNQDVDLILMDIKMPNLNGYEATQEIRKFNENVIIIAQTAFALLESKENAINVGCNDFIIKPVSKKTLLDIIESYFG